MGKINVYLKISKEVEILVLKENLEFNAALRKAKDKYKEELGGKYFEEKEK